MQQEIARLKSGQPSARLRVAIDPNLPGLHVSNAAGEKLKSYYSQQVEEVLHATRIGKRVLTPPEQNPFLAEAAKLNLDERGLIRADAVIHSETILASIVRIQEIATARDEPVPEGFERFTDDSLRANATWDGYVATQVEHQKKIEGKVVRDTISIQLEYVHRLDVGDVLLLGPMVAPVCGFVDSSDADILVSAPLGQALGISPGQAKTLEVMVASPAARHGIIARGTGPYSLITRAPLFGWGRKDAPAIAPAHIHTLQSAGLYANLTELLTF